MLSDTSTQAEDIKKLMLDAQRLESEFAAWQVEQRGEWRPTTLAHSQLPGFRGLTTLHRKFSSYYDRMSSLSSSSRFESSDTSESTLQQFGTPTAKRTSWSSIPSLAARDVSHLIRRLIINCMKKSKRRSWAKRYSAHSPIISINLAALQRDFSYYILSGSLQRMHRSLSQQRAMHVIV